MATLQTSTLLFSYSSSSPLSCSSKKINATTHVQNHRRARACISISKLPTTNLVHEFNIGDGIFTSTNTIPSKNNDTSSPIILDEPPALSTDIATAKLYAILEAVADRVEMHKNIGEQRDNWNALLLSSINMITLSAAAMAGLAASNTSIGGLLEPTILAFKLSSTLLFSAATGMLLVMNKLQPSQLAEEQRNAARLFKQIYGEIKTILALRDPNQMDVDEAMEKVLALDKAYPLPLLGVMLEKFPLTFQPAVWWPSKHAHPQKTSRVYEEREDNGKTRDGNGWSEEMEVEMREIVEVLKRKDSADYVRLGNLVLKINKVLAISSPILTGVAAVGSAFVGSFSHGSVAAAVAAVAGVLASVVNTLEHGGQVGMVFEMYRNTAGFFHHLQESIESTLEERELEMRENGELFEMEVALKLGRNLSELRELASSSDSSCIEDGNTIDEFASNLF